MTPKEHWPAPHRKLGLSMKFLETKDDCQYFAFEHSNAYQNIEKKFLEAVESLDPDNLVVSTLDCICEFIKFIYFIIYEFILNVFMNYVLMNLFMTYLSNCYSL